MQSVPTLLTIDLTSRFFSFFPSASNAKIHQTKKNKEHTERKEEERSRERKQNKRKITCKMKPKK